MMEKQLKKYLLLNSIAQKGETVFLGSTFLAGMNFGEFAQRFNCIYKIYNRSFEHLTVEKALEAYRACVKDLAPRNLFLSLGEEDNNEFYDAYLALVEEVKAEQAKCKIYLLSLLGDSTEVKEANKRIKEIAVKTGIEYIDVMFELVDQKGVLINAIFDEDGDPTIDAQIALWRRIVYPMRSGYEAYGDGIGLVSSINMIT